MGKVIVLGGNARSGKSTLAYKLVESGFSRISFDNIQAILKDTFNIDFDDLTEEIKFQFFENVINNSINESINENTNIVIDMYDYLPKDINRLKNKDKIDVYFLAYPNCSKEEIKFNVVNYAKPTDWIVQVNEEYLNECVDRFYERNKILVEECKKYSMELIDTKSGTARDKILSDLLKKIL